MKVNYFISSIVLSFAVFTSVFGQESSLSSEQPTNSNSTAFRSSQNEELSEDIIYERFFQFFKKYNVEADKQEQSGFFGRAHALRTHFPRKLLLNEQHTQQLAEIADQFYQEAATLKKQVNELKITAKEQPENQSLTSERSALKEQRSFLWSKYRDSLREAFGEETFEQFRESLQQEIAAKVKRTPIERKDKSVSTSTAGYFYTDSDIDYDPDSNTVYSFSTTTANGGGGGTLGAYFSEFCDYEEADCTIVTVEATMYDYEDFPIDYDFGESCFGEVELFLFGSSEEFETGEYVVDAYHEANYTGNSSGCALQAPDFTDTSGDNINIVIPKVRILLNGNIVTNTTQNVIVGQQISLSAQVTDGTPSNPQWTVPGNKVANYVVTYTNETSSTNAIVTELTSQNLTQSAINFYWVDGGDSRQVQYSVRVNNRTYTGKTTFNVKRPTVTLTTTTGTVGLGMVQISEDVNDTVFALHYGKPFGIPGIHFDGSVTLPQGFTGDTIWVQVANVRRTRKRANEQEQVLQGIGLDSQFPYEEPNFATTEDSPLQSLELPCSYTSVSATDSFTMWLLFKPKNLPGTSIYVPLRKVSWSWSGTGTRGSSCSWTLIKPTNLRNPTSVGSTDFPEWVANITQFNFQ